MAVITTARILVDRALLKLCGQECVDWAVSMLEKGHDGHNLAILAGMSPPFSHFEVADHRDRALRELGLSDTSDDAAIATYTAEQLRRALKGEVDFLPTLEIIKDLSIARDQGDKDLHDFYLLYFAYSDLLESEHQWYWPDATRENIVGIIRKRAEAFLASDRDRSDL